MSSRALPARQATAGFAGIEPSALQFLRDLKVNNDRDWFREHKQVYEEKLKAPIEALVFESAAAARKLGFPLYPKDKHPLTRIYRDIRFSSDKTPFHTYIGASLRGSPARASLGELYIHIEAEQPFVAAGFWMPERPFLHAWRASMAGNPAEFKKTLKALRVKKLQWLDGYSLKRLPRGFEAQAGGELEDYFKRQVYIVRQTFTIRDISSAALVGRVANFALAARPLLEYGWSLQYTPKRDMLAMD
jgi:uncharacterized protein (TIGR02453 family)